MFFLAHINKWMVLTQTITTVTLVTTSASLWRTEFASFLQGCTWQEQLLVFKIECPINWVLSKGFFHYRKSEMPLNVMFLVVNRICINRADSKKELTVFGYSCLSIFLNSRC